MTFEKFPQTNVWHLTKFHKSPTIEHHETFHSFARRRNKSRKFLLRDFFNYWKCFSFGISAIVSVKRQIFDVLYILYKFLTFSEIKAKRCENFRKGNVYDNFVTSSGRLRGIYEWNGKNQICQYFWKRTALEWFCLSLVWDGRNWKLIDFLLQIGLRMKISRV